MSKTLNALMLFIFSCVSLNVAALSVTNKVNCKLVKSSSNKNTNRIYAEPPTPPYDQI